MADRTAFLAERAFPALSKVTREALWRQNVKTEAELRLMTDDELMPLVGVDRQRIAEIRTVYPHDTTWGQDT